MYRIHFEPKGGFWCVQFLRWGFFWVTVRTREETAPLSVKKFVKFADAETYVTEAGICGVYEDRTGSAPSAGFGGTEPASVVRSGRAFVQSDYAPKTA